MPELSQLVRQRLASRGTAGDHPDADTLTAYTERLLPAGERNRVLEHIAMCSSCREVVALSQPETPERVPVVAASRKPSWRWKPALGLAASLATLAVITTVIIELPRKPATFESRQSTAPAIQPEADKTAAAPAAVQPESPGANATAAIGPADSSAAGLRSDRPGSVAREASSNNGAGGRSAPVPPPAAASVTAAAPLVTSASVALAEKKPSQRDYVNNQMFDANQNSAEAAPSVADLPAAPLPRTLAQTHLPPPLSGNAPLTFADLPPQAVDGKVLRSRQFSNPSGYRFGMALIPNLPSLGRKAERGVETMAKRSLAIQPGALTHSAMESNALAPAREEVREAEAKTRGTSADLDESSAFSQKALAGSAANNETRAALWKVSSGNLLRSMDSSTWNSGYGLGDIEFTVVTARGANVWAGGANTALVHSANSGATWERITLGASATGSITSIEVAGANVIVKSSSGQEWSSQDAGQTWSMNK